MKRSLPVLFVLVLMTGCREDEPIVPAPTTGVLRLNVVPEWEGAPMVRYVEYRNFSDYRVSIEMLKMHLGELRLVNDEGEQRMAEATYWDLGDGPVSQEWTVPKGTYTSFLGAIGVPYDLNHADPVAYGPGHPLNVSNGTYWSWAAGFRFVLFEGRYNTDPASTDPLITAYSIHTGLDTCYTALDLTPSAPIVVKGGGTTTVTVRLAVDRFFHSATEVIDLATEHTAHESNVPLAMKLTRNVKAAITVE